MHMFFTEEELKWIDGKKFGAPVKKGCPESVRKSIEKKRKIINSQFQ